MIYVDSVTVSPSNATITKGQWYYDARVSLLSDRPECTEVRWYSDNSTIAGVNANTGYIYGVNTGTTRVYAEATDDSGKKDYISVTVIPPISVTGVSVCPSVKSISVGETAHVYATVCPNGFC